MQMADKEGRTSGGQPPTPEPPVDLTDPNTEAMAPHQQEATRNPLLKALAYIGLDMTGPDRASIFQIAIYSLLVFVPVTFVFGFTHVDKLWLFISASLAIVPLAKILGSATEELALRVG